MGRPVTINGRELNINDAPFIEANAEYSVTVDDDGTVMVERTDLKAENAKLRYKVHILEGGNRELKVLYDSVKANNDRLRELCADMLAQLLNAYDPKELTEFFDRLHGVGIEVNG